MPRGRANFRKRDLAIAVETLQQAGLTIARVDVGKDGFKITTQAAPAELDDDNPDTDPETLAALKAVHDAKI
jgi:hypothetical protein